MTFFSMIPNYFGAVIAGLLISSACAEVPEGANFAGSLGLGERRILVGNTNAGTETVSMYDLEGRYLGLLADYSLENFDPQGIFAISPTDFLVSINGTDQIQIRNIFGELLSTISNTNLTGNLYNITSRNREIFVVESNTIESFSFDGTRIGVPRVNTTTGACVLSTARGIAVNQEGLLIVVGTGNDDLNVYDVSNSAAAACVTANTTMANIDPVSVIAHSNGHLYVATQGDDAIYQFSGDGVGAGTIIFRPGLLTLNNPTALLELPDGTILVASDGTNNILRIDTSGNLLSHPFMQNAFTGSVLQMTLTPGID